MCLCALTHIWMYKNMCRSAYFPSIMESGDQTLSHLRGECFLPAKPSHLSMLHPFKEKLIFLVVNLAKKRGHAYPRPCLSSVFWSILLWCLLYRDSSLYPEKVGDSLALQEIGWSRISSRKWIFWVEGYSCLQMVLHWRLFCSELYALVLVQIYIWRQLT